jgi:hypothetical protein
MQIWILEISTGEYEDRREGILRMFSSQKSADQAKAALDAELVARKLDPSHPLKWDDDDDDDDDDDAEENSREFYGFYVDSNGASLTVVGPYNVEE